MRRVPVSLYAATLLSLLAVSLTPAAWAQRAPPLQAASGRDTTSDTSGVLPGVPFVMRRADAVVAMAQTAPSIAPTVRTTRVVSVAAQQAARALEIAHAEYSAGHYPSALAEAQRAINLARLAIGTAMQDVPEALAAAEEPAGNTGPVRLAVSRVPVTVYGLEPTQAPPTYRSMWTEPFGASPSGLGAPLMRDSLPFGAEPIQPSRGLPPAGTVP